MMGLKCVENYLRLWYIMVLRGKRMNVFSCFLSQKAEHSVFDFYRALKSSIKF